MPLKKSLVLVAAFIMSMTSITLSPEVSYAKHQNTHHKSVDYEYSDRVLNGLIITIKQERKGPLCYSEIFKKIQNMSKAEAMDHYLKFVGKKITTREVIYTVREVFDIKLQLVSDLGAGKQVSTYPDEIIEGVAHTLKKKDPAGNLEEYMLGLSKVKVMDLYLESLGNHVSGTQIRAMVNQIFGINLEGISQLEGMGISIYSKAQWITQEEHDLFVIHTGKTDADVKIYPTEYFTEQTGLTELPEELIKPLAELGFYYNEEVGEYYYADPEGKSVPDEFKGKTIGTLMKVINKNYGELL